MCRMEAALSLSLLSLSPSLLPARKLLEGSLSWVMALILRGMNALRQAAPIEPSAWARGVCIKGIVVGEGDTYEEALADVKSAIQFHIETFRQRGL